MEKKDYNSNSARKGHNGQQSSGRRPRVGRPTVASSRNSRRDDDEKPRSNRFNREERPAREGNRFNREERPAREGNRFNREERPAREGNRFNREERPAREGNRFQNDSQDQKPATSGRRNHHGKSHSMRRPGQHGSASRAGNAEERTAPKAKTPPPTPKKYDGTTRLNKYIANAGICSRREADKLIAAGSVTVNGKVVTEMGYQVREGDVVNYGGETLRSERKRYFLLNKPKGFITTVDDPQERETVMMLIDGACPERIYPVGRLDRATTGLLLFTNDGDLARRLTHPSTGVYKIYQVEVDRPVTRDDMRQMLEGIELEDGPIHVDDIQYVQSANDKRIVGVELHSGKNRIVRRIFEHFGYNVHKLDRVVFAGLTKKDLPRGRYRELTEKEVGFLKMV